MRGVLLILLTCAVTAGGCGSSSSEGHQARGLVQPAEALGRLVVREVTADGAQAVPPVHIEVIGPNDASIAHGAIRHPPRDAVVIRTDLNRSALAGSLDIAAYLGPCRATSCLAASHQCHATARPRPALSLVATVRVNVDRGCAIRLAYRPSS